MPTITFPLSDLRALARLPQLTLSEVGALVTCVKGELKERASSEDEVKVELQDTNRPDTWCVEGIARALRGLRDGGEELQRSYPFFEADGPVWGTLAVDASVERVRPFVAAFVATGYRVDDVGLRAFISAQEVLCRNFGRQRRTVAIGIYDASRLTPPVRYEAVALDDRRRAFVPLRPAGEGEARDGAGRPIPEARWEQPWTPGEVLRDHPTGREYAAALGGAALAPILVDAAGEVLSFPPIINSRGVGRVTAGMNELFVEVTGAVLDHVLLALNVLAANLADRGARVHPVLTEYAFDTPRGRQVRGPHPLADRRTVEVRLADLRALLGEPDLDAGVVARWLTAFGVHVARRGGGSAAGAGLQDLAQRGPASPRERAERATEGGGGGSAAGAGHQDLAERATEGVTLRATAPAYRLDYLHPVDAIEDFAIARGYGALSPRMPEDFTVGALAPETAFDDRAREAMLGCGYEEAIGNILTSDEEVRTRMRLPQHDDARTDAGGPHGLRLVRVKNVMNRNYSVLRDWLLPTLLEVERRSTGAVYPHRVFEVGEAAVGDAGENLASRTEHHLAALLVHDRAGFSEAQAVLDQALRALDLELASRPGRGGPCYALAPCEHPSFISGRAASVQVRRAPAEAATPAGIVGELHPEVLERWGIYFPAVGFEVRLDALRGVG